MNDYETFIRVAPDCPVEEAVVPAPNRRLAAARMTSQLLRALAGVIAGLSLALALGSPAYAQGRTPVTIPKEAPVTTVATGTFDVKMAPQATDAAEGVTLGRFSLDKEFHGDLEATSKGEMLGARTGVEGSAGYVAIERVTGTLHGRTGSFVLQHSGTMTRGAPQLTITVVPDSGTGELTGLAGRMAIEIADGTHSYEFEYTLPDTP